ncbi:MAG TPA: glycosyltransferase family 4 protein [Chloroflexi bacterium]|nr:glycosyltransferase family 4 protein [Chloroflexota bacterium]
MTLITPRDSIDAEISQKLKPAVTIVESSAALPAKGSNPLQLARLVISLMHATPPSDAIVATHTPTTLPVLLTSTFRRKARLWLFMDYPEMFRTRPVEKMLFWCAPSRFPAIVTISKPLADEVRPRSKGSVTVMRPGLGLNAFVPMTFSKPDLNSWRILYIGDERPRKGLREFVQAMQQIQTYEPRAVAVIVCKSTCNIEEKINYELHIRPNDEALATLYRDCDIFVSTSWGEGLGYPALQAMAFGKPVVVTDSGGVHDYAVHGVNALIVPAKNPEAVANAVRKLLKDRGLRTKLQLQGQVTAAAYSWDTAALTFLDTVERLMQAGRS